MNLYTYLLGFGYTCCMYTIECRYLSIQKTSISRISSMYSRAIASTNTIVRVMHVYKDGVKSTIGSHMVYVVYVHMIFPSCNRSGLFLGVYASVLLVR